jgi:hypothetical protein
MRNGIQRGEGVGGSLVDSDQSLAISGEQVEEEVSRRSQHHQLNQGKINVNRSLQTTNG